MKTICRVALLLLLVVSVASAGTNFNSKSVKPAEVPAAVVATQNSKNAGATTAWRRNTWTGADGKQVTVFVGWYMKDKLLYRSAFTPTGAGYLTIVYLGGAKNLPEAIKTKVTAGNPGFQITAAQRYEAGGTEAFRTELRKGSTKIVKWTDANGEDLAKDKLPEAAEQIGEAK